MLGLPVFALVSIAILASIDLLTILFFGRSPSRILTKRQTGERPFIRRYRTRLGELIPFGKERLSVKHVPSLRKGRRHLN